MISYSIYVVDDEEIIRNGVTMALETDYHVRAFASAEVALENMATHIPDLVLLDIGLPGMDGLEALGHMKALSSDLLVVMITAYEDIETVISAMKLGAFDYVIKPIHMDGLEVTIKNALETVRLRKELQVLQKKYLEEKVPCFIGESDAIQDVMSVLEKVAKSPDTPVLILGGTGTGKELIAHAVHYRSPHFAGPLVTVNCSSIPDHLIESELFGYEKGAFSGASNKGKKGLVEEAAGGTLFLDEVGDLSLAAQAKLLRFLESGEYYRLGGTDKFSVQTRIVSATNKDLPAMIQEGAFRQDLYYRISVVKVEIPSLNKRRDDIIPIARYFLKEFSMKHEKIFKDISPGAEQALRNFHWEGNVRELKSVIERGVLLGTEPTLGLEDIGLQGEPSGTAETSPLFGHLPPLSPDGINLTSVQESVEKHYIEEALKITQGNETKAAKLLNLNHHTFRYRKRKLEIA